MTKIFDNILFIPHKYGQLKDGVNSPASFIKPLLDNSLNIIELLEKPDLISNLTNIYQECLKYNKKSLFIGGDHSIALSTIKAIYQKNMKIIWIDAHADINTIEESLSKNYHGMPLAFLTGLEKNIIDCPDREDIFVPFENILYIGIRSIDDFEKSIIKKHNIHVIDSKSYNSHIKETLTNFIGDSNIHISLDVDALDPEFMPCTGTLEENGISLEKLCFVLNILKNFEINSMDIVEFNPNQAKNIDELCTSLRTLFSILQNCNVLNSRLCE